jgi:D-sedoheptulose 7-phosphate isomerase
MGFAATFLEEAAEICRTLDSDAIERMADGLAAVRARGGRLFVLGVGGSAGNAGHAVNDFRKLCGIECYAPTDNVSELTARTNDEGWESVFASWLTTSRLSADDALLVFSVGGGDKARGISVNLVNAIELARERSAPVYAIVGRAEGHAAQAAEVAVVVPPVAPERITPHSEAFQAVIWHALVSHPVLAVNKTTW